MNHRNLIALLFCTLLLSSFAGAAGAQHLDVPNAGELDGIMLVTLPEEEEGVLTYRGNVLLPGESVPAESLDELTYLAAGSPAAWYTYLPVYRDGSIGEELAAEITSATRPPEAEDCSVTTYCNRTVGGQLPVTDDGSYTCQVLTQPELGMVTLSGGTFCYTPYQNRQGEDRFTYLVQDESGAWSREATVTVQITPQESEADYCDLAGHRAEYAALRLAEEEIYVGKMLGGARYFEPEEVLTKGEFLTLAMAASHAEPVAAATTGFSDDTAIPAWARAYVTAAVQEGVLHGSLQADGSTVLCPDAPVTWAEAAVILTNAAGWSAAVPAEDTAVPAWAASALAALAEHDVLPAGQNPTASLTRADAACLLLPLLEEEKETAVETGLFSWTTGMRAAQ